MKADITKYYWLGNDGRWFYWFGADDDGGIPYKSLQDVADDWEGVCYVPLYRNKENIILQVSAMRYYTPR